MASEYEIVLRRSAFWTPEQYVQASDLPGAERVAFTEPARVPRLRELRAADRVWRPEDYARLPSMRCHGPGYTLLEDVSLTYPGMALAADGRFVDDPLTRLNPKRLSTALERELRAGADERSRWRSESAPIERGILIAGPGMDIYGHHLLDYLPGLAMLEAEGAFTDWPLLLPASTPPWLLPMVEAFCGRRREIARFSSSRSRPTAVSRLCVPWVGRQPAIHPLVEGVFERLAESARARTPPSGGRDAIYVLRDDAGEKRQLTNGDPVRALLESRGLLCVAPQRLAFSDQVRLFAEVRLAVGEAGSGLHGMVFSGPGSVTVELRPPSYTSLAQPAVAVLRGQSFTSVAGAQEAAGRMSREPWSLELADVERRLGEVGL